jgi:uncharacterized protein YraI
MRRSIHLKNLSKKMTARKILLTAAFAFNAIGFSSWALAQQAKATKPADLLAEPTPGAAKSGSITSGQAISVLDKKGFWVKVQSGNQSGWVKLTDVELPNTVTKIDPMSTGRTSGGNIVNTAGVRGLSPDELKGSKPNTAAVDQAVQNAAKVSDADVSSFISSGGVVQRGNVPEVKVVKVSSSGNVSKSEGGMSATQSTPGSSPKSGKDSKEW